MNIIPQLQEQNQILADRLSQCEAINRELLDNIGELRDQLGMPRAPQSNANQAGCLASPAQNGPSYFAGVRIK